MKNHIVSYFPHRVVAVGGDGTFTECLSGLTQAAAAAESVDMNDPSVDLPYISMRLGLIPAGNVFIPKKHRDYFMPLTMIEIHVGHFIFIPLIKVTDKLHTGESEIDSQIYFELNHKIVTVYTNFWEFHNAGTGQGMIMLATGSKNLESSALHIIKGTKLKKDY